MKTITVIIYALLCALICVFLELNKNTVIGWILFGILAVGFYLFSRKKTAEKRILAKLTGWLGFAAGTVLIIFVSYPPVKAVPALDAGKPVLTEVIEVSDGLVQGVLNGEGTVEIYAGIPYAKPPVKELRWRKPQDPEPWDDVLLCDHFAPMSMQSQNPPFISSLAQIIGYHDYAVSLKDNYREPVSEDSLYLNIWKPAGEQKDLPVIVYIHGGSLQTGQPWYRDYSGEGFAEGGVICVNMGYRLGVFGFYADEDLLKEDGTTGNYGLLDQIKALEWVRDNIEAFGGDPGNVTLIGESAGAVCVDALCVSPLAEGLFQKAILESSTLSAPVPPHSYRSLASALSSGKALLARYGCASHEELRELDAEAIVNEMNTQHHVTADGYVLKDDPALLREQGVHNEQALLHGYNGHESGPFIIFDHAKLNNYEEKIRNYFGEYADEVLALYPAASDEEADRNWAEIYGAVFFNYSHYCLSRAEYETEDVYEYLFTKQNGRLSDWHSGEMVYSFGVIPEKSKLYDESDRELSRIMNTYWINFAKNGDPNGEGLPDWEKCRDAGHLLQLDTSVGMIEEPYLRLYEILDKMQRK